MRTLVLIFFGWPFWVHAAASVAIATIVDGEAVVIRDTTRYLLAEGVRVEDGDIIESAGAATVRLEFTSGSVLDLGPDTRLLLGPRFHGERRLRSASVYLLQGWTKVAEPASSAPTAVGVAALPVDVSTLAGSTVEHIVGSEAFVFQEVGEGSVVEGMPRRTCAEGGRGLHLRRRPGGSDAPTRADGARSDAARFPRHTAAAR